MNDHIQRLAFAEVMVGILHCAAGILFIIAFGSNPFRFGVQENETFEGVMVSLVALLLLVTGVLAIVGGQMLRKRTPRGRIVGLFAAFLMIVVIPLGTLVGSYGIWVLFQDTADSFFPSKP